MNKINILLIRIFCTAGIILSFIFLSQHILAQDKSASLTINLVAVNAMDEEKSVTIKHYLPEELDPEDVLDLGGLQLDYSIDPRIA